MEGFAQFLQVKLIAADAEKMGNGLLGNCRAGNVVYEFGQEHFGCITAWYSPTDAVAGRLGF